MSKNPHACTARTIPFPISGGDYVSDGKKLARAADARPEKPAKATKPTPVTPAVPDAKEKTNG